MEKINKNTSMEGFDTLTINLMSYYVSGAAILLNFTSAWARQLLLDADLTPDQKRKDIRDFLLQYGGSTRYIVKEGYDYFLNKSKNL